MDDTVSVCTTSLSSI